MQPLYTYTGEGVAQICVAVYGHFGCCFAPFRSLSDGCKSGENCACWGRFLPSAIQVRQGCVSAPAHHFLRPWRLSRQSATLRILAMVRLWLRLAPCSLSRKAPRRPRKDHGQVVLAAGCGTSADIAAFGIDSCGKSMPANWRRARRSYTSAQSSHPTCPGHEAFYPGVKNFSPVSVSLDSELGGGRAPPAHCPIVLFRC